MADDGFEQELAALLAEQQAADCLKQYQKWQALEQQLRQAWIDTEDAQGIDYSVGMAPYRKYPAGQKRWQKVQQLLPQLVFIGYIQGPVRDTIAPLFVHRDHVQNATFDEQGWLHSYDDKPALTYRLYGSDGYETYQLWLEHGNFIGRSNGEPTMQSETTQHWYQQQQGYVDNQWFSYGAYHHDKDMPAHTYRDPENKIIRCRWYVKGKPWRSQGQYTEETRDVNGTLLAAHRKKIDVDSQFTTDPSLRWAVSGTVVGEHDHPTSFIIVKSVAKADGQNQCFAIGDLILPEFLPKPTDTIVVEETISWQVNGKYHRDREQPANIVTRFFYSPNGKMTSSLHISHWYYHGQRHRADGPAIEEKTQAGVRHQQWFWFGQAVSQEQHQTLRANWNQL